MKLEGFLNPISEQEVKGRKVSDEEIFRSVQDMAEGEQMIDSEVNGGDDINMKTVQVKPTHKEALMAAFTLQKYITDINEQFARKLDGALTSFVYQTQMKATV